MRFRPILFWLHLASGVTAGAVIAVMAFTGATLAFEKEIIAFAERDAARAKPPAPKIDRLPIEEILRRLHTAQPETRFTTLTVINDPQAAYLLSAGRGALPVYVNPYTGETRAAPATRTRAFLRTMNSWHRALGVEGEHRNTARAVTGACNVAFLFLAVSGLCLWWPRSWSRSGVRAVSLLNLKARGRARDFNWHNVVGLWMAPILVVLTLTALPISYRWAGDLIYKVTGSEPPAQNGPLGGDRAAGEISAPNAMARPLAFDPLLASVRNNFPRWSQLTLRLPAGRSGSGGAVAPVNVAVRNFDSWPRTAAVTLSLDPFTGRQLRQENFSDQNLGRRVRTWTRFLHTGEAVGVVGQLVAGLASAGGCVLVVTGLALACRRFFGKTKAT